MYSGKIAVPPGGGGIVYVLNVSAVLSKKFIIRAGKISSYMFGNIEYKTS
jgi:hypothetical protein